MIGLVLDNSVILILIEPHGVRMFKLLHPSPRIDDSILIKILLGLNSSCYILNTVNTRHRRSTKGIINLLLRFIVLDLITTFIMLRIIGILETTRSTVHIFTRTLSSWRIFLTTVFIIRISYIL